METTDLIESALRNEEWVFGRRNLDQRMTILTYELGAVARSICHAECSTEDADKAALLANALVEMCDLQLQLAMLHSQVTEAAEQLGVHFKPDFEELLPEGQERQAERMKEWKQRRL